MSACPNDGLLFDQPVHPQVGGSATTNAGALAVAVSEPPSDLAPGTTVGEYRVEKKIGEGGMGAVYSAVHPMIGKRAAIKVISAALGTDASAVNRFVQEARSVNQIGHPNIVDVFAFGELPDGRNYFVMEHLQGESLAERIARAPMQLGEVIEIIDQVADALEAAHEKQIVHRDLKPDNVYLAASRGGRMMVKLLDFGIAKLSSADGPETGGGIAKTRTGMMMGTPGYLSPEQARGRNVDHRTDIYALGCMTFEVVTGRIPFTADNAMDIVLMHMTAPPPRTSSVWPQIPPALDNLIAGMLEKDASLRPTLAQIRQTFSELVSSGAVTIATRTGPGLRSGLATPGRGMATPPPLGSLAMGTHLSTHAPATYPPATAGAHITHPPGGAPKKRTGLIVGIVAGVVLAGVAVALFATGGGDETPAAKPAEPVAVGPPPTDPKPPMTPTKVSTPTATPTDKATPPPTKPAGGSIELGINVDNAEVTVDGKPVVVIGRTATIPVETDGPHTVAVTAAGRDRFEQQVELKEGATVKVAAELEPAKALPPGTGKKPPGTGRKPGTGKKPPGTGQGSDKNYTVDPFAN